MGWFQCPSWFRLHSEAMLTHQRSARGYRSAPAHHNNSKANLHIGTTPSSGPLAHTTPLETAQN
eukprot:4612836-Amphidinium_carterae.1